MAIWGKTDTDWNIIYLKKQSLQLLFLQYSMLSVSDFIISHVKDQKHYLLDSNQKYAFIEIPPQKLSLGHIGETMHRQMYPI